MLDYEINAIRVLLAQADREGSAGRIGELAQRMRRGNYFFPFVIYREHVKKHGKV